MLSLVMAAQTPAPIPSAPGAGVLVAPKPPADPFPPVNPKFFTATTPTVAITWSWVCNSRGTASRSADPRWAAPTIRLTLGTIELAAVSTPCSR